MNELTPSMDLFLPEEHAILSDWFNTRPAVDSPLPSVEKALDALKFGDLELPDYSTLSAAVAFIILESIEDRLPQWAVCYENGDSELARDYRSSEIIPDRTVIIVPRHLMTINWADSGPGFSWPVSYNVTWLPQYDRYVVTASADSSDRFGYPDFALGHFGKEQSVLEGAKEIITRDWHRQYDEWGQHPWAYLFNTGLVSESLADNWAHNVWPEEAFMR